MTEANRDVSDVQGDGSQRAAVEDELQPPTPPYKDAHFVTAFNEMRGAARGLGAEAAATATLAFLRHHADREHRLEGEIAELKRENAALRESVNVANLKVRDFEGLLKVSNAEGRFSKKLMSAGGLVASIGVGAFPTLPLAGIPIFLLGFVLVVGGIRPNWFKEAEVKP